MSERPLSCMEKSRDCWGEVATYSFDMDLPNVTLCMGHMWALTAGAPPWVKAQYVEEMEGLNSGE